MGTLHQEAFANAFDEHIQDPLLCKAVVQFRRRLQAGAFPNSFVDVCFQSTTNRSPTMLEAYGFLRLWDHLLEGEMYLLRIPIGGTPFGDQCIESNQTLLNRVPKPFHALFVPERGRGADDDGHLKWDVPVTGRRVVGGRLVKEPCQPTALCLEVGSTVISKTLIHVAQGGVARWPYGHKWITALVAHQSLLDRLYGSLEGLGLELAAPPM
jgi:hypothetical protein